LFVALAVGGCALPIVNPAPLPKGTPAGSPAAPAGTPTPVTPSNGGPATGVLVGAGDIATCGGRPAASAEASATAALLSTIGGTVFTAGDDAYPRGTPAEFRRCYGPTWGAFKGRTLLPAPGNHDFVTTGGGGYFDYFGPAAGTSGEGWYSSNIGGWHIVILNSNCWIVGCNPGSVQLDWLEADLAQNPARCTLAIWHHPRFSSGFHGDNIAVDPFWEVLWRFGADVVVNGHDHNYERFAPQDPQGVPDPTRGIREFVVGTGGAPLRPFQAIAPNSEARDANTFGLLVLTLHPESYDWRFTPVAGETYTDSGSGSCH